MNEGIIKELKLALEKEKELLTEELRSFALPDKKLKGDWDTKYQDIGSGWDENAQEVTEYATKVPIEHNFELRLLDIEKALEKIGKNSYGICEKCGEPIDIERLKANPEARNCVQHS